VTRPAGAAGANLILGRIDPFAHTSIMIIRTIGWWASAAALAGLGCLKAPALEPLPAIRVDSQKRGFVTAERKPFVPWGVNYFRPGTGWAPQLWKKFDPDLARLDFERMQGLGINCVRVFLTWGSFFEQPGVLSQEGLRRFDQLLDLAESRGIYVHPTGPDHWEGTPAWARGDRFTDETLLRAQEEFWRLLAARYRGRSAIFAYDLLNEPAIPWESTGVLARWKEWLHRHYQTPEQAARAWGVPTASIDWEKPAAPPPSGKGSRACLLDYQRLRESVADAWVRRQAEAIRGADPDALVTVGLIQWSVPVLLPGLQHYAGFRPERIAPLVDFLEIHFYPLAGGFYEYDSAGEVRNLAYLESVVRECARFAKPVVVAEFGWYGGGQLTIDQGRHRPATEEDQARWCRRAVEVTAGLACGWLNWGLYDHPEARDVTQLTGLLDVAGQTKAWGRAFQELGTRWNGEGIPPPPALKRPPPDWDAWLTNPEAARSYRDNYLRSFHP